MPSGNRSANAARGQNPAAAAPAAGGGSALPPPPPYNPTAGRGRRSRNEGDSAAAARAADPASQRRRGDAAESSGGGGAAGGGSSSRREQNGGGSGRDFSNSGTDYRRGAHAAAGTGTAASHRPERVVVTNQNGERVDGARHGPRGTAAAPRVVHRVGMECLSPINVTKGDGTATGGESNRDTQR